MFIFTTFPSIQLPIWTLTLCISTFFFLTLKSAFLSCLHLPWMLLNAATLNAGKIIFLDFYFFILTCFFFALHSSIVKPCSVTSNKNYTPSLPKPLWPAPHYLIRTHLLLWDWSFFQQDPASKAAYTSHSFCTPTCTSLFPTQLLPYWEEPMANTFKTTLSSLF